MSPDEQLALDVARALIAAGVPVFAAQPDLTDGQWNPTGGTGGTGYRLPTAWQTTVPTLSWLDPSARGFEGKAWRPGWALCLVTGVVFDGLDTDPRHGGHLSRQALQDDGLIPAAYGIAHTPSGGTHELIKALGVASANGFREGLDYKGGQVDKDGRGFLFIAPTVRLSKTTGELVPYRWATPPDPATLDDADDSGAGLAELIRGTRVERKDRTDEQTGEPFGSLDHTLQARVQGYVRHAVAGGQGELREAARWTPGQRDAYKRGWEKLTADVAYRLGALASAQWNPLTIEQARDAFMEAAPTDGSWKKPDNEAKWAAQHKRSAAAPWPAVLAPSKGNEQPPAGNPAPEQAEEVKARKLVVTRASEITVRPVHWLWADRLPLGSLALLAGREGIGKSTVGYQLAADLTRGTLPGRYLGQPKSVVIAATEDSWEHTIVPRLMAASADLHRVLRVDVVTHDGDKTSLTLPRDTPALGRLIEAEDVALVLLDPLMSRLDGALDSHKDAEVRVALEPITAIADRTGAAVLGIIHVNKGKGADALDRIMGSRAFSAVARSVLFVLKDPDDENLRTLGTPKNNLGRTDNLPTLRFGIVGVKVADTDEGEVWTGRIDWQGEDTRSIDELLQNSEDTSDNRSATGEAAGWLVDYLTQQGGEAESSDAKKSGAKAGHSIDALKRARKQAKVTTRSHGFPRTTIWFLPELVGQSEQPSQGSPGETHLTALTAPTGGQSVQSVQSVQSEDVSRSRPDCVGIAACADCGQPGERYRGQTYAYCSSCRTTSAGVAS